MTTTAHRLAIRGSTALVDTSVLIAGTPPEIDEPWVVSVITIGELDAGVQLAGEPSIRAARLRLLSAVLVEVPVIPIDRAVASRYGELRAATGRKPTNDLWIAATALAHDLRLMTADERLAALPSVRSLLVRRPAME